MVGVSSGIRGVIGRQSAPVARFAGETLDAGALVTALHRDSARRIVARCYYWRMIDWSSCPDVERDPDRVRGAWVFCGARVPIKALFENLEDDVPLHEFIEWFQGVTLQQARQVLKHAARSTLQAA